MTFDNSKKSYKNNEKQIEASLKYILDDYLKQIFNVCSKNILREIDTGDPYNSRLCNSRFCNSCNFKGPQFLKFHALFCISSTYFSECPSFKLSRPSLQFTISRNKKNKLLKNTSKALLNISLLKNQSSKKMTF